MDVKFREEEMAEKIGAAVIGCGRIGATHLGDIKGLPVRIDLSLCS